MRKIGWYIFMGFLRLATVLPLRVLYIVSYPLFFLLYRFPGYRRGVARENLTNSFPDREIKWIQGVEKRFYRHLADLFSEEDRHLPAVLAAYNAGMAKCREWIARFEDVDLFIERIGWWETRAYVRHVLDAAWKYADAYGGGSAGIDRGTGDPEE